MFPAPLVLGLLIAATPVMLTTADLIAHGFIAAAAAVLTAIVAVRLRPSEIAFLRTVVQPMIIFAALPLLWILFQLIPLGAVGLANPIWQSAAVALGRPLAGSISIDTGATLLSLAQLLSITAIAFAAAAIAVERRRAEWILVLLTAAMAVMGLMVLAANFGNFSFPFGSGDSPARNAAADGAGLGVILAAATAIHAYERRKTLPPAQRRKPDHQLRLIFFGCLFALTICAAATIIFASSQTRFSVGCGMATLFAAIVMRSFRFGPWGYSAVVSIAVVMLVAVFALQPTKQRADVTLAYASGAPASLIALTQRVIMETSLVGTGAGTFSAVLPIYRDINEEPAGTTAPTAAAAIAVEMGQPFLWIILIAAGAIVITLLRGAVRRGRDSLYATAGASCLVCIVLLAFGNVAVFSAPILVTVAVITGTAITQSKSRAT